MVIKNWLDGLATELIGFCTIILVVCWAIILAVSVLFYIFTQSNLFWLVIGVSAFVLIILS